jgi:hypothetical protein
LFLDVDQLARQFNTVRFDVDHGNSTIRYVTAWISGERQSIQFERSFDSLVDAVAVVFEMEIDLLRIYVLQFPGFSWKERIRLTKENFNDYIRHQGTFLKTSKLYACEKGSPDGSPGGKEANVGEGSQSSISSNRSGQVEFSEALRRRDKGICVFCKSNARLEGAHFIPVKQKDLLNDPSNCTKYGISSIMDTTNGILLCWDCHKCFDANLVCIDPITGNLNLTDALLANEGDKWKSLVGHNVPASTVTWPTNELLKFREDAMFVATKARHESRSEFTFFCEHCQKGYKKINALSKHEMTCESSHNTPSTYKTPVKGGFDGGSNDDA